MSYCRFSEADAYIYDDIRYGLYCCGCLLTEERRFAAGEDFDAMLAHIANHREAGHDIPTWVDQELIAERDELTITRREDKK